MSPEQTSSKIGKSVGEKLRTARIAQHLTQSQLASPDFSVSYISAIERGQIHPSLRALEILAGRLGLSSTQLLPNRSQGEDRNISIFPLPEREEEEIDLTLIEINVSLREGDAALALTQLAKIPLKRLKRSQLLRHRFFMGWAHYKNGHFQQAEYVLNEALQIAKELNDHYLTLRILYLLALTYTSMRNHSQAHLSFQRCLSALELSTIPLDPLFALQLHMQIGQYYTQQENLELAIEAFRKALDVIGYQINSSQNQQAYIDIVRHHSDHKEYDLATLYAYKSQFLTEQTQISQLRSELYYYLGQAMLKNDLQQARSFLDNIVQQEASLHTLDKLSLASLNLCNAAWHFEQHAFDTALTEAQKNQELITSFGDTIIGAETYTLLGRIAYAQGQQAQGDTYFAAGLSMFERLELHEELANESVQYAQLLEEHGKEHEAFVYFRRAFQSRQELGK
ncbi:helix-turn-helix transcriptional regulator [Ktedonospora formicarum]|uniref:HTH cro/C1-type domain-containing protein n=1 Tax=Ktedonospora formicarum TaxID=2778364 RepID=A0A8J3I2L5_9CHLR|nr:helix-turn-helix transcriptional regulator [Ktedonospora formicarum]GHO43764.1 hypothetical protein KSX_19270 [Ktedonospora formicarum]